MPPNPEEGTIEWRFEYKYRLTYGQYYCVRSAIKPNTQKDNYSLASPTGRYFVRSLYFDTDSFKNFEEKVNGDSDRVKLRIRTYSNLQPEPEEDVRVELKARKSMTMEKYQTWVTYQDYQEFMKHNHWPKNEDAVLEEFERYVHLKTQRPKIIVEYQREGYVARDREAVRITFDHHVRSAKARTLYPKNPFFRKHYLGMVILEIKCNKKQPQWLLDLVQDQGLKLAANSKYVQGIEAARPDIVKGIWSNQ